MAASLAERAMRIPVWARLCLAAYCLLVAGEASQASSWAQALGSLALGLVAAPIGVAVAIAAVELYLYDQIILAVRGVRVTATIEGYSRSNPRSDVRYAVYRYRPLDGEEMTNTSAIGVVFMRAKGTEAVVRYDPQCPQLVAGLRFPVFRTLVGIFLTALGTAIAVGSVIAGSRALWP